MNEVITIGGVDCYEKDGTAYLKLEAVARGLGFTTTQNVGGTEYVNVRWKRVEEYLEEIGFCHKWQKTRFHPRKYLLPPCNESQKQNGGKVSSLGSG